MVLNTISGNIFSFPDLPCNLSSMHSDQMVDVILYTDFLSYYVIQVLHIVIKMANVIPYTDFREKWCRA